LQNNYQRQHDALERNRLPDFQSFIEQLNITQLRRLNEWMSQSELNVKTVYLESEQTCLTFLRERIESTQSKSDLREMVKLQLQDWMNHYFSHLQASTNEILQNYLHVCEQVETEFQAQFMQVYEKLATLDGLVDSSYGNVIRSYRDKNEQVNTSDMSSVRTQAESDETNSVLKTIGLTGAGAVVGTMIFPVVGTIIGAAIGYVADFLFGKELKHLQVEYYATIEEKVSASYVESLRANQQYMKVLHETVLHHVNQLAGEYVKSYGDLITQMVKRDEDEKRRLQLQVETIFADLQEIERMTKELA
jgi:hypothetical protein